MFQTDEPMIYFGPTVISQIQHTCIQKFFFLGGGVFFSEIFLSGFFGGSEPGESDEKDTHM